MFRNHPGIARRWARKYGGRIRARRRRRRKRAEKAEAALAALVARRDYLISVGEHDSLLREADEWAAARAILDAERDR